MPSQKEGVRARRQRETPASADANLPKLHGQVADYVRESKCRDAPNLMN